MRKILKIVLFPVVIIVRFYRRRMQSPSAQVRRLFAYDCERFLRYSGSLSDANREALRSKIIMAYHCLEKGLTMPRRRMSFGHQAVRELIELVQRFEFEYGATDGQVRHAAGVIAAYLELHKDFTKTDDSSFWREVAAFVEAHNDCGVSVQPSVSAEDFYRDVNASFPNFCRARHTTRHYSGTVFDAEINAAVELAGCAPSACNRQYVKVHCISEHKLRDAILAMQNGNRGFGSDADKLLLITGDLRGIRWSAERNDLYTNCGIFIMNLCYALFYMRLGHCILNWSAEPSDDIRLHKMTGIPENEVIAAMICVGRTPDKLDVAASPKKPLNEILVVHK